LYYGWRYYQPETGRWLSADPGGLIDGPNLFRFCKNNPISLYDEDGQDSLYFLYGVETSRAYYLKERARGNQNAAERRYLRVDDLNYALGIESNNMTAALMKKIKQGIVVDDKHISLLIRDFSITNRNSSIGSREARNLLQGWSDFLKKNYTTLSVTNRLNKTGGEKYKDKKRTVKEALLKNYPVKARLNAEITEDMITPFDSTHKIKPQVSTAINLVSNAFKSSNQAGFAEMHRIYNSDTPLITKAMASSAVNIFFRKTSKLGLDFAFSDGSGVSGVDFLTYIREGGTDANSIENNLYAKPWHHLDTATETEVYSPITSSELRYAKKKKYLINEMGL
ncbi:RHS repeat-associated core domain-containing protein, partial [Enterobacter chuandaensis]